MDHSPANLDEARAIANKLGLSISISQDQESWKSQMEQACALAPSEVVMSWVAHRVANVIHLVIKDTQFDDVDLMLGGVASAMDEGIMDWERFSAAMKHHGVVDGLAEMEARLLSAAATTAPLAPPARKRL